MKPTTGRVYLMWNYWDWHNIKESVLPLLIRIVTSGPNHAAWEENGIIKEMQGSNWRWILKKLLGLPVSYAANEGSGYTETPLDEWLLKRNRRVKVMIPVVPVHEVEITEGYGFLDLPQGLLHHARTKWFLCGNNWNGKSGTRIWKGMVCSEYLARKLGKKLAHLFFPSTLEHDPDLEFEYEFYTEK